MGGIAHQFHIRPWEHDLLTVWDYYGLTRALDAIEEALSG